MNGRERFLRTMRYEAVDHVPLIATGGWPETGDRWRREGWDGSSLTDRFGADAWIWCTNLFFPCPEFVEEVLEERATTRLIRNHEGIVMEVPNGWRESSMPHFIRFPVETLADFNQFASERLQPQLKQRLGPTWKNLCAGWAVRQQPLMMFADRWGGFFGPLRNLMGVEKLCTAFYDDPSLIEAMMDHIADLIITVMGHVLDTTSIDMFAFWEDMAYRGGSLLSPTLARRFMLPRYKRVVEFLKSRGVEHIGLDSDGDVLQLIPIWLEAGIEVIWPFEVQSGMDVVALRRQFGRDLRMLGGIDKRALALDPTAIRHAVDSVMPLVAEGGYVPYLDHSAPPDISWTNYTFYMEYLKMRIERG